MALRQSGFVLLQIKIDDKRSITQYEKLTAVDMMCYGTAWLKIEVASGQLVKASHAEFYDHKCTYISYIGPTVCSETGICRRILLKIQNMNFHENPFRGSRPDICGKTGGHDEAYSHFWHTNAPGKEYLQRFYAVKLDGREARSPLKEFVILC